jgi:transposase
VIASLALVQYPDEEVTEIEKMIRSRITVKEEFAKLLSLPVWALLSPPRSCARWGRSHGFLTVRGYSSCCRCMGSSRLSNGTVTGHGNKKNGNKYLVWVCVEAAQFA